jgi:hypothetical protein
MGNFDGIIELGYQLNKLAEDHAIWSQTTFGDDNERGPIGPLKHLEKEAKEVQENPTDISEYADCFLLILDSSRRAGISPLQLIKAAQDKLVINKARKWPKPNEWVFGEPHFVDSEDCMGNREVYWRVWADREDQTVAGVGTTKEQAIEDAKNKIKNRPVEHEA